MLHKPLSESGWFFDVMDGGGTNNLTSAEVDKETEDSKKHCISRKFSVD
jgi:hypothetical protein